MKKEEPKQYQTVSEAFPIRPSGPELSKIRRSWLYDVTILEMAKIACASIPEDLCDQMDLSDDFFTEIESYIQNELNEYHDTRTN